jgi:D-xylose transport system substrate-binding protein
MTRGSAWPILIVVISLLAAIGPVAAGCGGGEDASGTIALLLPDEQSNRYRSHDRPEFERKVRELCDGCKVTYGNAGGSAPRQQKQAEGALAKGAKVLVVDPVDPQAAAEIVQKAKLREVPVISYDRLIFNARVDYYVDVESEAIGEVQAQALSEKLGEMGKPKGPLALITTNTSGPVNLGASLTFNSTGLKVAAAYHMPEAPEASVSLSEREMRRAISTLGPNGFGGVYAVDDKAATGVIEAMKSAGINPQVKVTTGSGATIPGLQRLLTGQQYMTVYEANKEEAATAAELATELAKGEEVPDSKITDEPANGLRDVPAILLQPVAVTKDNIRSTVIDNGFVDPAQLCAGSYAKYCREAGIETE